MKLGLAVALLALSCTAAYADSKDGFDLFNPTPDADLRSFCADRPTRFTYACTVDAGHVQIESDLINGSFDRHGGATYLWTDPTVKLGLTNTLDAEVQIAPVETVVSHGHDFTGVGDLYGRLKWNLMGDDSGDFAVALEPYVKAPTANHRIGNGAVEEGVIVPINANLPAGWTLTLDPEADVLKDQSRNGFHDNYSGLVSLSHPVTKTLSGTFEVWSDVDRDPAHIVHQTSFDFGGWWSPEKAPNFQIDAAFLVGLNRSTPTGFQIGFGRRF